VVLGLKLKAAGVSLGVQLELHGDARRHREGGRVVAPRWEAREDLLDPDLSRRGLTVLLRVRRVGAVGEGVALPAVERGGGGDGGAAADGR